MKITKKTFKEATPIAIEIGEVLANKTTYQIGVSLGMLMGVNSEEPEDLEDTLDLIRFCAYAYRVQLNKEARAFK